MTRGFHSGLLAALALLAASTAPADDLGRLFTTTAERARINALRSGRALLPETTAATAATDEQLLINGTLSGSDGKRLVWINGARAEIGQGVQLLRDGRVRMQLRDGALQRDLRPGQGIDTLSGEVFERYTRAPTTNTKLAPATQAATPLESEPHTVTPADMETP